MPDPVRAREYPRARERRKGNAGGWQYEMAGLRTRAELTKAERRDGDPVMNVPGLGEPGTWQIW